MVLGHLMLRYKYLQGFRLFFAFPNLRIQIPYMLGAQLLLNYEEQKRDFLDFFQIFQLTMNIYSINYFVRSYAVYLSCYQRYMSHASVEDY